MFAGVVRNSPDARMSQCGAIFTPRFVALLTGTQAGCNGAATPNVGGITGAARI
jgi:hypothetical protein